MVIQVSLPQHPFIDIYKEKVLLSLLTWLVRTGCSKNEVSFSCGAAELVLQGYLDSDQQTQIWTLGHNKGMCGRKPE